MKDLEEKPEVDRDVCESNLNDQTVKSKRKQLIQKSNDDDDVINHLNQTFSNQHLDDHQTESQSSAFHQLTSASSETSDQSGGGKKDVPVQSSGVATTKAKHENQVESPFTHRRTDSTQVCN